MKDVILFVNAIRPATFAALDTYREATGRTFVPVVLVDEKIHASIAERNLQKSLSKKVTTIIANFDSPLSIRQALRPFMDRIFAVTSQYENSILELRKLAPYLPHHSLPTESSLEWATEKKLMRELLESHDTSLVPGYMEVKDYAAATLNKIERTLHYPLMVKPSGLEGSLLVTRVENRADLQATLRRTFREMQKAYDKWIKRQKPSLVVEEFMEGDMYSVDTYVSPDGIYRHAPLVKVVTGHKVGFDDFFGYMRVVPTGLSDDELAAAYTAAEEACKALALRSVTAHVELMKTADGWKIIELGPRIGGFRHDIYQLSYGINHIVNDIRNRAGEIPEIPTSSVNHTAFFNFYAQQEGMLKSVDGIKKIKRLSSFVSVTQDIKVGEPALFAKNNGDPVIMVMLSNANEAQFNADVEILERTIRLRTEPFSLPDSYKSIISRPDESLPYLQNPILPSIIN